MCPIPLTPLTAAVRTLNVLNVRLSNRDLALAALCFVWATSLSARFPRRYVSEQMPSIFRSIAGVFYPGICVRSSDVLGTALPARLDFSIVDTFAYSRVPSEHPYSPAFGSHVFLGGAVLPLRYGCRGKRFYFVGLHRHQSMRLADLHCQYRRVLTSVGIMTKGH